MRVFYCDHFVLPLPDGHRFPMAKYSLLRARVAAECDAEMLVPEGATDEDLRRVHGPGYVRRVAGGTLTTDELGRIGFPWSPELVERSRRSVGGTMSAGAAALRDGVSVNLAGGTHHAFADRGEGFCVFNDVAVAVRALQSRDPTLTCAVLDLDVHQGNGTAAIFADDASVFTLSAHGANNFPFRKHASDLDVPLPDGADDDTFLRAVERSVRRALSGGPDLAFYVAGADAYRHDRLGRLGVSKAGMAERDRLVFDLCAEAGAPVAVVMSGGYAADIDDTVDIHFETVRRASEHARAGVGR